MLSWTKHRTRAGKPSELPGEVADEDTGGGKFENTPSTTRVSTDKGPEMGAEMAGQP